MAATIGEDLSPLLNAASVPLINPASKLVGWGIGISVANAEAVEIYDVMRKTHPVLVRAAAELKISLADITKNNQKQLGYWKTQKRALLGEIRTNDAATAAEFRAAAAQARNYQTQLSAIKKYPSLLNAMIKAHAALMSPSENADAELANFLFLARQAAEFISALKPSS